MASKTLKSASDTLVDTAYQKLRKDITEEYLQTGSKISINDLCVRYGVSPTPIKQALNRLMAEGLVESIPHKGCRVRNFSWTDLDELFEMRSMMETHFAPQATAAVQFTPILQAKFEKNIQENLILVQNFSSAEEYFRTYEMDREFHELFILASGNHAALRIFKALNTHSYAAYLFGKQPRAQTIAGIKEHREIFEAMKAGNSELVCTHIHSHVENARNKIRLSLKLENISVDPGKLAAGDE